VPSLRDSHIGLTSFDREQFSLRNGLVGLVAITAAIAFLGLFGYVGVAAVFGAVVTVFAAGRGPLRSSLVHGSVVAVGGAGLTVVGVWSGETGWIVGLVAGLVTFGATLFAAYGKAALTSAYVLNLWILLAQGFSASDRTTRGLAASFLVGGVLAVALQPLRVLASRRSGTEPLQGEDGGRGEDASSSGWAGPMRAAVTPGSPIFQFAVTRALVIGSATLLGALLFEAYPYWAALAAFVIFKSDPVESVASGVHRAVGTLAGAAVAFGLVQSVDSRPVLTAAVAISAILMVASQRANEAVYAFFLTIVLLLALRLVRADVEAALAERVWATLLGVGVALAVMAIVAFVADRRSTDESAPSVEP
jgi:hypothetical protein